MPQPISPAVSEYGFEGELHSLEVARGYDGILGGRPKPVVIVALYLRYANTLQTIGRTLHRFAVKKDFPSVAKCSEIVLPTCGVAVPNPPQFIALAIALEEDGGKDVQRLFSAVEDHRNLLVWKTDSAEADPLSLLDLPGTAEWARPSPVQLLVDQSTASTNCRSDKWVGASCWSMLGCVPPSCVAFRATFRSADRRNDWTGLITAQY